ncbi:hypothetical protein [Gordonia sp. (in: high G+C Gram-positive bacteria)]
MSTPHDGPGDCPTSHPPTGSRGDIRRLADSGLVTPRRGWRDME